MGVFVKTAADEWTNLAGGKSGELPGIGGWADVTAVTGVGTKYEYTADGMDWSAFEWTADGDVTTSGGLVDALLVGGGTHYSTNPAYGGRVNAGIIQLSQSNTVTVGGLGAPPSLPGTSTSRSAITETNSGGLLAVAQSGEKYAGTWNLADAWGAAAEAGVDSLQGWKSSITESEVEYGKGYNGADANNGEPGSAGPNGGDGRVIIRVPRTSDKTGLPAGAFDTTTLRNKVKEAVKRKVKR
jgi:hypothetical protein